MHIEKRYYLRNGVIEVEQISASMYGNHSGRSARGKPTTEDVRKSNLRRAGRELRRKIDANFIEGDIYLTLTYGKDEVRTWKECLKDIKKFLANMKYRYRKRGQPFKWIRASGLTKKGMAHHHLILNKIDGLDYLKEVKKLWKYGRGKQEPLYEDEGRYAQLADYLVKHKAETGEDTGEDTKDRKAYSCSRNLKKPRCKVVIISEKTLNLSPKIPTGYRIQWDPDIDQGIDSQGYRYRYFRLIRKRE